jgi:hypothetical protein
MPDASTPPDSLGQLCDDLTALYAALGVQYDLGPLDRSTPAPAVAAALTPTAPSFSTRRRVPASRPPLDLEGLAAQEGIDRAVRALLADIRAALALPDRPTATRRALQVLPRLLGALPEGHHLTRRAPAVLEALRARARHVLDLDERWFVLGQCPEIHQTGAPVGWDSAGRPVAYVEVRDCMTYDVLGSLDATKKRRDAHRRALDAAAKASIRGEDTREQLAALGLASGPVDIWRRSHIRIDRDADLTTAVASCSGCPRTWDARERARLGRMLERDAAARLLAGQAS